MTIKQLDTNISAENVTQLFDMFVHRDNGGNITSIELTRKNFYTDNPADSIDLMDYFYTEQEIDERIKIHIDIYQSFNDLPKPGKTNHIYLVPFTTPTDTKEGIYKEYIWTTDNKYEAVGSTEIDLTDMQLKSNISTFLPTSDNDLSDSKYPSEKLLKTLLNLKVDKRLGYDLSQVNFTPDYETKLNNIEYGANKTIVDTSINSTSTNPVQNKAIYTELNKKVDKVAGKQLSTNDFTNAYKNKIDNISTVGITNNYNDLDNLPVIPQKTSDLVNDSQFITVAQAFSEMGVVDVIQDGNPKPASSNAVYDNSRDIVTTLIASINDTVNYTVNDEEEEVKANLIEIFDVLTQMINDGD